MSFKKLKPLKILASLATIAAVIAGIWWLTSKPALAAWFDDTFSYRKKITIGNTGSAATYKKVKIEIDTAALITAGKMQTDCDDTRFTSAEGKLLNFYIDTTNGACNTSSTDYYVMMESIIVGNSNIYFYYGNPSAVARTTASQYFVYPGMNESLISFWELEEASGDRADSIGGNTLTDNNTVTQGNGIVSGTFAGQFTAASSEYLSRADNDALSMGDIDWTMSAWVYADSLSGAGFNNIVSKRNNAGATNDYALLYSGPSNAFNFVVFDSAAVNVANVNSGTGITTGVWYHIVAWHDATANNVNISVNGAATLSTTESAPPTGVNANFKMGAVATTPASFWDGRIDSVGLWKKVLTQAERDRLYSAGVGNYQDLFVPTSGPTAASEEKTPGPVAYWKFDEGTDNTCSGGTNDTCDSMGKTAHDGAITNNATWKSEDLCVSGKCMYFDGTDDVIRIADTPQLDVGATTDSYTVSGWVRTGHDTALNKMIIGKDDGSGAFPFKLFINTSELPCFNFSDGTNLDTICGTTTIHDSKWHYLVGVRNVSSDTFYLYVDGLLVNSLTDPTTATMANNDDVSMGSAGTSYTTNDLNGFLDEIKVYSYARSQAQINSDYVSRGAIKGVTASLGANKDNNPALSNGLVGYWKLDEASGNRADSSGNATTLTDTNTVTSNPGKFGLAGQFTSASSEYLTVADNATLSVGDQDFTVSQWVYFDTLAARRGLMTKGDSNTSDPSEFRLFADTDGSIFFQINPGASGASITTATSLVTTATWYHIVAYHDSVNNKMGIILNGELVKAGDTGASVPVDSALNFSIGRTDATYYQNGRIDETRFYKRLLSPKDISNLYNWAPGAVGYWRFDENTGTAATDFSSNGNTGTLNLGPTWTTGKYGQALNFDGSDDNVTLGSGTTLNLTTGDFTTSAWFKTTMTGEGIIIGRGTPGGTNSTTIRIGNASAGILGCRVSSSTQVSSSGTYNDGFWHFVSCSADRDGSAILYVDGVQIASGSISGTSANSINNADNWRVGHEAFPAGHFSGSIDEIKIYSYVRTTKQIVEDMNAGHPSGGSPISSMVGYWNLDEQQGQTANDKGVGLNNGTLGANSSASTDDPTWKTAGSSSCKVNGCQSFDGGDYINFGDVSDLELTTSGFTISTWAKSSDWVDAGPEIILSKWTGDTDGDYYLGVYQNKVRAGFFGNANNQKFSNSITTPTNAQWYHLATTWSGVSTDPVLIYINGKLDYAIESNQTITSLSASNTGPSKIGARGLTSNYFNGQLDEVKYYNSALTADEIKIDYNAGSAVAFGGVLGTQDNEGFALPAYTGLWTLDENKNNTCTGGTNDVCDRSGNAYDGAITGALWAPGKVGSALLFDGVDDNVDVTNISVPNNQDFTISAWANIASSQAGTNIGIFGGCNDPSASPVCSGGDYDGILLRKDSSDKLWLSVYFFRSGLNQCSFVSTNTVPLGQWVHLAATFDEADASSVGTLYINGVKETLVTNNCASVTSAATTLYPAIGAIKLSNNGASTTYTSFVNGRVDNVKFYFDDLTQAQISYDYNRGAAIAYYKFDECQGTTAYNAAPAASGLAAGNNGTITPGASGNTTAGTCGSGTSTEMWNDGTTGKINSSLGFDFTDDYVTVADAAALRFDAATEDFSVFAWVKRGASGTNTEYLISKEDANDDGWRLIFNSSNLVRCSQDATDITSTSAITDTNWHLIGCTIDRDGNGQVYIDGRPDGPAIAISADAMSTTASMTIGKIAYASSDYFNGLIDEVRIYNYALSVNQIKQIFNNGAVFFGPATGSP